MRNEEEINCDVSCELLRAVRWRLVCSGNEALRCGLLARNDSISAMPRAPSRAAAIKCRSAHKYKSYRIVLLLVDAPGGPQPWETAVRPAAGPHNAAKFGLANVAHGPQITYSSLKRVLQVWKGPSSSSFSSLVRERIPRHFGKRRFLPGIPAELAREDTDTLKARLILGINARYTRSSDSNKNLMFQEFISRSIHIFESPESSMNVLSRVLFLRWDILHTKNLKSLYVYV